MAIEILFPVQTAPLVRYLRDDVLGVYLADNVKARRLQADGTYTCVEPHAGQPLVNSQTWLLSHQPWRPEVAVG